MHVLFREKHGLDETAIPTQALPSFPIQEAPTE